MLGTAATRRVVAIGGGKGGVGKSLISSNLAVALARAGANVTLLDADLGAPNLHTLLGVSRPPRNVQDFLDGHIPRLIDAAVDTSVPRLKLICGTPHSLGATSPTFEAKQRLIQELATLRTDVLLIDVGAGVDLNTIDFFNAADIRLVVMTPEVTSIENGYGFLKIAIYRRLQRAVARKIVGQRLDEVFGGQAFQTGSTMEKMSTFLSIVDTESPAVGQAMRLLLREFNASLIGNMLQQTSDRNVFVAVQRMIKTFLSLDVPIAAMFRSNRGIRESVNQGRPFAVQLGSDYDLAEFSRLAKEILSQDLAPLRAIRASISQRLAETGHEIRFGLASMEAADIDGFPHSIPPVAASLPPDARHRSLAPLPDRTQVSLPAPSTSIPVPEDVPRVASGLPEKAPEGQSTPASDLAARGQEPSAVSIPVAPPAPPPAPAPSAVLSINHPVELQIGGHWLVGRLRAIGADGALIVGIRPLGDLTAGTDLFLRIRTSQTDVLHVRVKQFDRSASQISVLFSDANAAALALSPLMKKV